MMQADQEFIAQTAALGLALSRRNLLLATAESCTGGWVAKVLTDRAGSSAWFETGFVTYSNEAKQRQLGVHASSLAQYGAVSEQVAEEMARGAVHRSRAQVALAVTGIAGPGGGTAEKPVGLVYHGLHIDAPHLDLRQSWVQSWQFEGDRDAVRRATVAAALAHILHRLNDMPELA